MKRKMIASVLAVMLLPALCACGEQSGSAAQPSAASSSAAAGTVTELTNAGTEETSAATEQTEADTKQTTAETKQTSAGTTTETTPAPTVPETTSTAKTTVSARTTASTVRTSAKKTGTVTSAAPEHAGSESVSTTVTTDKSVKDSWNYFAMWLDTSKHQDYVFDGEFLTMQVKIADDAPDGVYPIGFMKDDFANYAGSTLEVTKNPGWICVNAEAPEPAYQSGGDLTLTGSIVSGKPGDTVTFTVSVSDNSGCG